MNRLCTFRYLWPTLLVLALPPACVIDRTGRGPGRSPEPGPTAAADAGTPTLAARDTSAPPPAPDGGPPVPSTPPDAGGREIHLVVSDAGAPEPPVPDREVTPSSPDVVVSAPDVGPAEPPPAADAAVPAPEVTPPVRALPVSEHSGLRFVRIPAGRFAMGSPADEPGRNPNEEIHEVTISRDFELSVTEITQAQYERLAGSNPSETTGCPDCPVESVTWSQAAAFANLLSTAEGLPACYTCEGEGESFQCWWSSRYPRHPDCPGFRLPTEAEWEYAARAGTTTAFYNGPITGAGRLFETGECDRDERMDAIGWYCANAQDRPHPVGGKAPNAWGLYDMSGNVAEFTADADTFREPGGTDPWFRDGTNRTVRGGAWYHDPRTGRSAAREWVPAYIGSSFFGFRLARTLVP